jgi:hypothetical protein
MAVWALARPAQPALLHAEAQRRLALEPDADVRAEWAEELGGAA